MQRPIEISTQRWPWLALGLDVVLLVGTAALYQLLRGVPVVAPLVSLGGHPGLVQALAGVSLVTLVVLAPVTQGFVLTTPVTRSLLAIAGMLTLIASAGVVAVFLALPSLVLLLALGGRIFR